MEKGEPFKQAVQLFQIVDLSLILKKKKKKKKNIRKFPLVEGNPSAQEVGVYLDLSPVVYAQKEEGTRRHHGMGENERGTPFPFNSQIPSCLRAPSPFRALLKTTEDESGVK